MRVDHDDSGELELWLVTIIVLTRDPILQFSFRTKFLLSFDNFLELSSTRHPKSTLISQTATDKRKSRTYRRKMFLLTSLTHSSDGRETMSVPLLETDVAFFCSSLQLSRCRGKLSNRFETSPHIGQIPKYPTSGRCVPACRK